MNKKEQKSVKSLIKKYKILIQSKKDFLLKNFESEDFLETDATYLNMFHLATEIQKNIQNNQINCIEEAINQGLNLHITGTEEENFFFFATGIEANFSRKEDNYQFIKFLKNNNLDINQQNNKGQTCLFNCAQAPQLIPALVENGIDLYKTDKKDQTALSYYKTITRMSSYEINKKVKESIDLVFYYMNIKTEFEKLNSINNNNVEKNRNKHL